MKFSEVLKWTFVHVCTKFEVYNFTISATIINYVTGCYLVYNVMFELEAEFVLVIIKYFYPAFAKGAQWLPVNEVIARCFFCTCIRRRIVDMYLNLHSFIFVI